MIFVGGGIKEVWLSRFFGVTITKLLVKGFVGVGWTLYGIYSDQSRIYCNF